MSLALAAAPVVMWLFRKGLDISRAAPRLVTQDDLTAVSRLLRDGTRRYLGLNGGDLAALLAARHGMVLEADGELYAVAVLSPPAGTTCWLRAVALAEGVEARPALGAIFSALHTALAAQGLRAIFYSGDEAVDGWLVPALTAQGYTRETEVLVYEKSDLSLPDGGNPAVEVRPAAQADLAAILRLDQHCFEPQWTKDDTILGPAIDHGPYFAIATLEDELVGYAYATTHFNGRLVHLVRIAVAPRRRGARIGARLLAEVVTFAAEQHATVVTLNTQAYNTHAQRLYRWFGFAPTGERQSVLRCSL